MNRSAPSSAVIPVLAYPDVREAVAWLERAFGAVERVQIGDDHRSQLNLGGGDLIVADVSNDRRAPDPDGASHSVMVRVDDADAHYERARDADATILKEPADFPFGERQYTAQDLAGHRWTFSQTVRDVAPEEWGGITRNGPRTEH